MIAQHVRKYGAKARYQGEEAGEGRLIGAMRSAQQKAAWEGFQRQRAHRALVPLLILPPQMRRWRGITRLMLG